MKFFFHNTNSQLKTGKTGAQPTFSLTILFLFSDQSVRHLLPLFRSALRGRDGDHDRHPHEQAPDPEGMRLPGSHNLLTFFVRHYYRAFHGFGKTKFPNVGSVLCRLKSVFNTDSAAS